jgi:ribosome-associated protein
MEEEVVVRINTPTIKLDQFLKWTGTVQTGGEGKSLISNGLIMVNDVVQEKRGKIIKNGDKVSVMKIEQKGSREVAEVFIVYTGGE